MPALKTDTFCIFQHTFDIDLVYSAFSKGWYFYRHSDQGLSSRVYETSYAAENAHDKGRIVWLVPHVTG